MSPTGEPQAFKGGGTGGGRLLGLRESNQALQELKTKLEFALSRLNDQDTQRTGVEEIREFLQTLYPDWFPIVISCIGEAGTNLKPLGRCESVKLLGLLAELHGDAVVPLLPRILQVVVTRLQDADLHLREACAETVFRLASALVLDVESGSVFATLLKPLFGALGEHSKWVQIGAAACICSVIQGSPSAVIRENLGRLSSRLVQFLSLPLAMARPQLLCACVYAMQAVEGADFDEVLPALMPCLESCLSAQTDWQTRKQAVEVLQTIGDNTALGQTLDLPPPTLGPGKKGGSPQGPTPLQRRIASILEAAKTDKVRAVREAAKDVLLAWCITKVPSKYSAAIRSGSPSSNRLDRDSDRDMGDQPTQRQRGGLGDRAQARSPSPTLERPDRDPKAPSRERPGTPFGGADVPVTVLAPKKRGGDDDDVEGRDEKSAKKQAVKEALSNAALNVTKKPKPKKERESIFKGRSNPAFFGAGPKDAQARSAPAMVAVSEMSEGGETGDREPTDSQAEDLDDGPDDGADAEGMPGEDEDDDEEVDELPPARLAPALAANRSPSPAQVTERSAPGERAQDSAPARGQDRRQPAAGFGHPGVPKAEEVVERPEALTAEFPGDRVVSAPRLAQRSRGTAGPADASSSRETPPGAMARRPNTAAVPDFGEDDDVLQLQTPSAAAALLRGEERPPMQPGLVGETTELTYSDDDDVLSPGSRRSGAASFDHHRPSSPFDFDEMLDTPGAGTPAATARASPTPPQRPVARGGRAAGARAVAEDRAGGAWDWDDHPSEQKTIGTANGWDEQPAGQKTTAANAWEDQPVGPKKTAANNWDEQPAGPKKGVANSWEEQPTGPKKAAANVWEEQPVAPKKVAANGANSWEEQPVGSKKVAGSSWEEQPVGPRTTSTSNLEEQPVGPRTTSATNLDERPVCSKRNVAAGAWDEQTGGQQQGGTASSSLEPLLAELAAFKQRLQLLEEERRETEDGLGDRLRIMEQGVTSQHELLAAQEQRMEAQAKVVQSQEQQLEQLTQRLVQQEQRAKDQERRLREQGAQMQQQDQLFEQQEQVLKEHEQQLEQQEQHLEQHKLLIDELLAAPGEEEEEEEAEEEEEDFVSESGTPQGGGTSIWPGPTTPLKLPARSAPAPVASASLAPAAMPLRPSGETSVLHVGLAGSSGDRPPVANSLGPSLLKIDGLGGVGVGKALLAAKKSGAARPVAWERALELCEEQRYLEAYKQAIAEPEEACLLRLMQHTGPIVERLDAESNSRLIRRLIHILSSPSKEPASICIEQIFSWLWQALDVGIHFTTSQVEDLAAALQKVSAPASPLTPAERADAGQLLQRVAALRR